MAQVVGVDMSKVQRVTCRHCASIIEYTMDETSEVTHRDYSGSSDTYRLLDCPKCHASITVSP